MKLLLTFFFVFIFLFQLDAQEFCFIYGDSEFNNSSSQNIIINPQGPINIYTHVQPIEEIKHTNAEIQKYQALRDSCELLKLTIDEQKTLLIQLEAELKETRLEKEALRQSIILEKENHEQTERNFVALMHQEKLDFEIVISKIPDVQTENPIEQKIQSLKNKGQNIINNAEHCLAQDFKVVSIKDAQTGKISYGFSLEEIRNDPNYVLIDDFSEGLARVRRNNKFGFYNSSDSLCIPFKYDYAENFYGEFALVKNLGEWFLINKSDVKSFIISKKSDINFSTFCKNVYKFNNTYNYYDYLVRVGDTFYEYNYIGPFNEIGIAQLRKGSFVGFIDNNGEILLEPESYTWINKSMNYRDLYETRNEASKYGIMDTNFKVVLPNAFDDISERDSEYSNIHDYNFFLVEVNNLFGLVNIKGETILACLYDKIIVDSLIKAQKSGKWGIFDLQGKELLGCSYDDISRRNDVFLVTQDSLVGVVDNKGSFITPAIYREINGFDINNLAIVKNTQGKYGLLHKNGELAVKCEYDRLSNFYKNLYEAKINGSIGLIDNQGNIVMPLIYRYLQIKQLNYVFLISTDINRFDTKIWILLKNNSFKDLGEFRFGEEIVAQKEFAKDIHKLECEKGCYLLNINNLILSSYYIEVSEFNINNHIVVEEYLHKNQFIIDANFNKISDNFRMINLCKNGMYRVANQYFGYLNADGKLSIELKYESAELFESNNTAIIGDIHDKFGVIDNYGAEIINVMSNRIERTDSGFKFYYDYDRFFLIDFQGKCISEKCDEYNMLVKKFNSTKK